MFGMGRMCLGEGGGWGGGRGMTKREREREEIIGEEIIGNI
jgi:hypothetical protein